MILFLTFVLGMLLGAGLVLNGAWPYLSAALAILECKAPQAMTKVMTREAADAAMTAMVAHQTKHHPRQFAEVPPLY